MASPFILSLASVILVFFAVNALLFMIARIRESNRDSKERQAEEGLSEEEIDGMIGSDF